jgi:hypothetical protein
MPISDWPEQACGKVLGERGVDALLLDDPPPHPVRPGNPAIARVISTKPTKLVRDNRITDTRQPLALALCESHLSALRPNIMLPNKLEGRFDSKCIMHFDGNQAGLVRPRIIIVITSAP